MLPQGRHDGALYVLPLTAVFKFCHEHLCGESAPLFLNTTPKLWYIRAISWVWCGDPWKVSLILSVRAVTLPLLLQKSPYSSAFSAISEDQGLQHSRCWNYYSVAVATFSAPAQYFLTKFYGNHSFFFLLSLQRYCRSIYAILLFWWFFCYISYL